MLNCTILCLISQISLMPAEKERTLRSYVPKFESTHVQQLIDKSILYTDEEIPSAYQLTSNTHTTFIKLPQHPGGTESLDQQLFYKFKSIYLPGPIVYWTEHLQPPPISFFQHGPIGYRWIYPVDTLICDFLIKKFPSNNKWATFTVRSRLREIDDWDVDVFVPILTQAEIPSPFILLRTSTFKSSTGTNFFPTATDDEGIVPKGYSGESIGNTRETCINCHQDTLRQISNKHQDYYYPGSDGINSFHPIDPASFNSIPRINPKLSGLVEHYDPKKHSPAVYKQLSNYK